MSNHSYMNTNYQALLVEYAAGTLDQAQTLVVTAHLSLVPEAREIVQTCESIGGALIEKECRPVEMSAGCLDKVLGRIDQQPQRPAQRQRSHILPEDLCEVPSCVEEYIVVRGQKRLRWKRRTAGIHAFDLPLNCRRSQAQMYRLDPGVRTPQHKHTGLEITLVLNGAFQDEEGAYQKGALVVHDKEDEVHSPVSCENHGCICINVTTGSIQLTGPIGRLLNPFMRF